MPLPTEYPAFFGKYIALVPSEHVHELSNSYGKIIHNFYQNLPDEKADYAYAEGKWTLKQVLQHVIDTERIFMYRLLRFLRQDATPLSPFDENSYATAADVSHKTLADLKLEFAQLRASTNSLIDGTKAETFSFIGTAGGKPCSARAVAYIPFGHAMHHKNIVEERYL